MSNVIRFQGAHVHSVTYNSTFGPGRPGNPGKAGGLSSPGIPGGPSSPGGPIGPEGGILMLSI